MGLCFHKYVAVDDLDERLCAKCWATPDWAPQEWKAKYPEGHCSHGFKVCIKCGKAVGYGSHGKLSCIPDTCKPQIEAMRAGLRK